MSDFEVLRLKIIYAIYKLQEVDVMWYLPSSKLNAAVLWEMLFPVELITGHLNITPLEFLHNFTSLKSQVTPAFDLIFALS